MDNLLGLYFRENSDQPNGGYHKVIPLHESKNLSFSEVQKLILGFPRGWFELAHLRNEDRIEFTRDYWMSKMLFHPQIGEFLYDFFARVDQISVYILQKEPKGPYSAEMAYSLKGESSFFRAALPASEQALVRMREIFLETPLPADYMAFMEMHNGLWKTTDITGLIPLEQMPAMYQEFQGFLLDQDTMETESGKAVNPKSLIPFYESFGMPYYQCFFAEWYPEDEMGNVYVSKESTVFGVTENKEQCLEKMCFQTFSDWLIFYLDPLL